MEINRLTLKQKTFFLSIYAIAIGLIIYSSMYGHFETKSQQVREIIFFIFAIGLSESNGTFNALERCHLVQHLH